MRPPLTETRPVTVRRRRTHCLGCRTCAALEVGLAIESVRGSTLVCVLRRWLRKPGPVTGGRAGGSAPLTAGCQAGLGETARLLGPLRNRERSCRGVLRGGGAGEDAGSRRWLAAPVLCAQHAAVQPGLIALNRDSATRRTCGTERLLREAVSVRKSRSSAQDSCSES